jgi:hypothetical protein
MAALGIPHLYMRTHRTIASVANLPPLALLIALTLAVLGWNAFAGISWQPSLLVPLPFEALFFGVAYYCSTRLPERAIAETTLYYGLWMFWPLVVTQLTYLGAWLDFPLRDQALASSDLALGFNWLAWVHFVQAHPLFLAVQSFGYGSHFWQPFVAIPIIAAWGPVDRNGEFLTSMLIAAILMIALSAVYPALGPAEAFGAHTPQADVIRTLRTVLHPNLSYTPIVTFPSFHTVMAILFTFPHRGNRVTFPIFAALNALMLIGIPYCGDHYLSDMLAGAAIAISSFVVAQQIYRRFITPQMYTSP